MDDIGTIDQGERLAYVVIGDQHANPARFQMLDEILDVSHRNGIDACEGSSSSMKCAGPQRTSDLAAPALTAESAMEGECLSRVIENSFKQGVEIALALFRVGSTDSSTARMFCSTVTRERSRLPAAGSQCQAARGDTSAGR